jgi:hypothetical protein
MCGMPYIFYKEQITCTFRNNESINQRQNVSRVLFSSNTNQLLGSFFCKGTSTRLRFLIAFMNGFYTEGFGFGFFIIHPLQPFVKNMKKHHEIFETDAFWVPKHYV